MAHHFLMPIITFNPFSALNFLRTGKIEDKVQNLEHNFCNLFRWNQTQLDYFMKLTVKHNLVVNDCQLLKKRQEEVKKYQVYLADKHNVVVKNIQHVYKVFDQHAEAILTFATQNDENLKRICEVVEENHQEIQVLAKLVFCLEKENQLMRKELDELKKQL